MQRAFKDIIELLKESSYTASILDATCEYVNLGKAIEIVKQTGAEYNNGWIACTDRLPTPEEYQRGNGRFLVTDGNRTYEAEFDIYESHTFGRSQMSADWFVTDKCVTHWQNEPLPPKTYQPKGE